MNQPAASAGAAGTAFVTPMPTDVRERVLRAASTIGALGGGATAAPELLGTLCSAATTARDISRLLGREPALYARVLRIANSSFYGQSRSVASIEKAIVLLGLDAIRGIVAAACLDRFGPRASSSAGINSTHIVAHSLATAVAADAISARLSPDGANDAFLAGLLHNLGVFVQLRLGADQMGQVARVCAEPSSMSIREIERSAGIVTHEECFAVLADAWHLPAPIALAGAHHHEPGEVLLGDRTVVAVVGFAARLAISAGIPSALDPVLASSPSEPPDPFHVDPDVLEQIRASLPERVRALGGVLPAA